GCPAGRTQAWPLQPATTTTKTTATAGDDERGATDQRKRVRLRHGDDLVDDSAGAVGRGVGNRRVQLAVGVLAEAVDGQAVGQHAVGELWEEKFADRAGCKVGVEEPAVGARGGAAQGEVAEDVFAEQLGDFRPAIDEPAGDG